MAVAEDISFHNNSEIKTNLQKGEQIEDSFSVACLKFSHLNV